MTMKEVVAIKKIEKQIKDKNKERRTKPKNH